MKLAIDVGNTTIALGLFNGRIVEKIIISTDLNKAQDDFFLLLSPLFKEKNIDTKEVNEIVYCSVVPQIDEALKGAIKAIFKNAYMLVINTAIKTGFKIDVQNKDEIGGDLLAGLQGAYSLYGYPILIADLGTATKILSLNKEGVFTSCLIIPGMDISASLLSNKAALLPSVGLEDVKEISKCNNTIDAMKGGIVYGHSAMVEGLIARYEEELGYQCKHVITGGATHHIEKYISKDFVINYDLVLFGLIELLKINAK
ncbi:MAG: type III pantothenate kinase [Erysipelotrichaceae bacterium]|jgi:type III pantothenate kinase|nr:type III pantothenate kinase [Erysipelotrichaceae bacterium]